MEHLAFLKRFYRYEQSFPSHDTLFDVFAALDPELFKACLLAWINGLRDDDPDIIAIDVGMRLSRYCSRKNVTTARPVHVNAAHQHRRSAGSQTMDTVGIMGIGAQPGRLRRYSPSFTAKYLRRTINVGREDSSKGPT
jgi:hypothetical protein